MTFADRTLAQVAPDPADLRVATRFALMLRATKLVGQLGEYLCIVRDVSATGVRLRLFHPLANERRLGLEGATGDRRNVEKMWERDGEAGFRFEAPIDLQRFIAEGGPHPKRPFRISVDHLATITVAGEHAQARLRNLSRQGAGIEIDRHLAIGQNLCIEAVGLPMFEATVCWRQHPAYGLVFRQLMSLEELSVRSFAMQTGQRG